MVLIGQILNLISALPCCWLLNNSTSSGVFEAYFRVFSRYGAYREFEAGY